MKMNQVTGFLEAIDSSSFIGWAYRSGSQEPLALKLIIDGRLAETFTCQISRFDVAEHRHDLADGEQRDKVGFSVPIPPEYFDDLWHLYEFRDAEDLPVHLTPVGDCTTRPGEFCFASKVVFGQACVSLDDMRIAGWVVILDRQTTHKSGARDIEISNAWGKSLRTRADIQRADVADVMDCEPGCGFDLAFQDDFVIRTSIELSIVVLPERIPLPSAQVTFSESLLDARVSRGREVIVDWPVLDAAAPISEDLEDTRIRLTAFPRSELFGLGDMLSDLRAKMLQGQARPPRRDYTGYVERLIVDHFDADYYLAVYEDVATAGIDPLAHFVEQGWIEGRKPTAWFDTAYYLDANPDIKSAGVNPFWHYLVVGRQEGRRTVRLGGSRRTTLENAVDPRDKTRNYRRMKTIPKLFKDRLIELVQGSVAKASGFVMSLSQDCYTETTGGIQIFIADEQKGYARRDYIYLNASPVDPDLVLATSSSRAYYKLVLNGKYIGIASFLDFIEALKVLRGLEVESRTFIIHCLLGHNVDRTLKLADFLAPTHSIFWLHDYSSVCPGYNLLRNDVEFCGAPSVSSVSCRICVYGDLRPEHLLEYRKLFESLEFVVVAPSRAALDIWLSGSDLPYRKAVVHSHCYFEETSVRVIEGEAEVRGSPESPLRIAFVGHPASHKGWPIFEELVSRVTHLSNYRFFHFLSGGEQFVTSAHIERVVVRTTADHRDAMTQALSMYAIDLVMMLSPWPETFSYVTFEALAAGADVIAFRDSGNVADTLLKLGRGIVIDEEAALYELLTSLRLILYMHKREEQGIVAGALNHLGTTSTLHLDIEPDAVHA